MFSNLPIFQVYGAMARHAAESQRVSAENISRAGEPGFKAMQVESFSDYISRVQSAAEGGDLPTTFRMAETQTPASPNGNTVSIEHEIFKSAEALGEHNMALTVYTKTMDLMRTAIGKRG